MKFDTLLAKILTENIVTYTSNDEHKQFTPTEHDGVQFRYRIEDAGEAWDIISFIISDTQHRGTLICYRDSEEIDWEKLDGKLDLDNDEEWTVLNWTIKQHEDFFESAEQLARQHAAQGRAADIRNNLQDVDTTGFEDLL